MSALPIAKPDSDQIALLTASPSVAPHTSSLPLLKKRFPQIFFTVQSADSWMKWPTTKETARNSVNETGFRPVTRSTNSAQPRSAIHASQIKNIPGNANPSKSYSASLKLDRFTNFCLAASPPSTMPHRQLPPQRSESRLRRQLPSRQDYYPERRFR